MQIGRPFLNIGLHKGKEQHDVIIVNVNDLNYECNLQLAPQNNGTQCTSYKKI